MEGIDRMSSEIRPCSAQVHIPSPERADGLLSEHVRSAVERYFEQLEGYQANNLYEMVLHEIERPLIETVLRQCGHNQSRTAQLLGLSRSTLRKKMIQHGIE
jgi:Fis family transcriptional regulator